MMLTLTRDYEDVLCTLGTLEVPGRAHKLQTLEQPWRDGERFVSCVREGVYRVEPRESEARGKHWILSNAELGVYRNPSDVVSGSTAQALALIHAATDVDELFNSIAVGKLRTKSNGRWSLMQSRDAMNELKQALNGSVDVTLCIRRRS